MNTRAILFTGINQVELAEAIVPDPAPDEVLVEALYTAVSPGTELRCLAGKQRDSKPFPFVTGYSLVGKIIAKGVNVTLPEGALVLCSGTSRCNHNLQWGGHIGHAVIKEENVLALAPGINPIQASLLKLTAITYHGLTMSKPLPHEIVAVVGLGPIGLLSALLHSITGARVLAMDLSPERVALAQKLGLDAMVPSGTLSEAFRKRYPEGADVVVDSTGAPSVLKESLNVARDLAWNQHPYQGARVLIQGSYADDVPLPHGPLFMKELTLLTPRDSKRVDLEASHNLMQRGLLKIGGMIQSPIPVENAPSVYEKLRTTKADMLTAVFAWR